MYKKPYVVAEAQLKEWCERKALHIQIGDYLSEDDISRYEDLYGRK